MNDQSQSGTTQSATAKEIQEWQEENDAPHPIFQVEHRPERSRVFPSDDRPVDTDNDRPEEKR